MLLKVKKLMRSHTLNYELRIKHFLEFLLRDISHELLSHYFASNLHFHDYLLLACNKYVLNYHLC